MIKSPTGAGNFPYLGLVQGRDNTNSNLAPESFHYVYISSTAMSESYASICINSSSRWFSSLKRWEWVHRQNRPTKDIRERCRKSHLYDGG